MCFLPTYFYTVAGPTPALKPEVGGGQSSPRGWAAAVSPQGLWVHWEPKAALLEGRPGLPTDRRDPTGGEVGEVTAEGAPELRGSQELLALPQTCLFWVCHLSWGAPRKSTYPYKKSKGHKDVGKKAM